ncbi:MAG: ATP-binding protein [Caldilineaceae bacterium]
MQRDDDGNPLRVIGINWDVTDEQNAAEAMQRALEQEKELGELKSRFVSMASHELRTPMATISATTETLLLYRHRLEQEKIDARLRKILDQVGHMKEISEDVLQLSRIQSGRISLNLETSDLDHFCNEIIEDFRLTPSYRDRIAFQHGSGPLPYSFDPRLMRRVVGNLLSNALKYSDGIVTVDLKEDTSGIHLAVSDHVIGIPKADIKRMFEPFHRAANVGAISGTGLGLPIVKEVVERHGGSICVQSEAGVGTAVTLMLPPAPSRTIDHAENSDH